MRSSIDGLTWTDYSANTGLASWQDFREIEYAGGAFHAGGFYGRARRSTNAGLSWSTTQIGDSHTIGGFANLSGVYYAVGINESSGDATTDFTSSDGITWTTIDPGSLLERHEIGTFAGTLITVGDDGTIRQSGSIVAATDFGSFTTTYFPGGGSDAEATANSDNDWADNFTEYALGGDPTDGDSTPSMPTLSIDLSGFPVLEVTRTAKQTDVAYSIWWSTDLIDWTQAELTLEVDDETTLRVRGTNTATAEEKAFFRLIISQ